MKVIWKKQNIIKFIESFEEKHNLFVAHGCNCFCTMGAGVALALTEYTNGEVYKADVDNGRFGDINKLGTFSKCIDNDVEYYNCYTQFGIKPPHGRGVYVHWDSVFKALATIINQRMHDGDTLVIVPIGTGLAGGSVVNFESVISKLSKLAKPDVTLVICDNSKK